MSAPAPSTENDDPSPVAPPATPVAPISSWFQLPMAPPAGGGGVPAPASCVTVKTRSAMLTVAVRPLLPVLAATASVSAPGAAAASGAAETHVADGRAAQPQSSAAAHTETLAVPPAAGTAA